MNHLIDLSFTNYKKSAIYC